MINRMQKFIVLGIMLVTATRFCVAANSVVAFYEEQKDVKLAVVDCTANPPYYSDRSDYGTPLVPGLGVKDFTEKGMHPIRVLIQNTGTQPIVIAPKSFRMQLADSQRLTELNPRGTHKDLALEQFFIPFYGAMLGIFFGMFEGSIYSPTGVMTGHLPFSLSNYPVLSIWLALMATLPFYIGSVGNQAKLEMIQKIEKYFLTKPITIQPGQMLEKIVLLDGQSVHSLFNIFIFNHDQTEHVAIFNVELAG